MQVRVKMDDLDEYRGDSGELSRSTVELLKMQPLLQSYLKDLTHFYVEGEYLYFDTKLLYLVDCITQILTAECDYDIYYLWSKLELKSFDTEYLDIVMGRIKQGLS